MAKINYPDEFVLKVRAANKTMTSKQMMKKFKLSKGQLDYTLYNYEIIIPEVAKVEVLPPEKEVKKMSVTERYNPQPLSIYGRLKRDVKWLFGFGKS